MRPRRGCLLVVLLLLALAGHVWFWYVPRLRAASPDPADLPGQLLAAGGYDACFWIPYPHQNLGALAAHLPDVPGFIEAAARLAEVRAPELPGFGPFAVPPAREITACSDRAGHGFRVAARIYPAISWIAKAAGRLAGNPWLSGGTVEQEKRTVRIAWQGSLWTVEAGETPPTAALPPPLPAAAEPVPQPALAAITFRQPVSIFPAGTYRLRQNAPGEGGVTLARDGSPEAPPELAVESSGAAQAPGAPRPILLAVSAPGDKTPAALALFSNVVAGSLELPGAAAFFPPGGHQRWSLPAQSLMDLVTGRLPRGNAGGWSVVALDDASLRQALALAPALARLVPPESASPPGAPDTAPRLRLGLWIDPSRALAIVHRLRQALEAVPFLDPQQVRRWRDAETVLTPLARCGRAALAAAGPPDTFSLRLAGCN